MPNAARTFSSAPAAPGDLVPLVRYFRKRFEREHVLAGEHVTRTDLWYGTAPIQPPGGGDNRETAAARLEALLKGTTKVHFRFRRTHRSQSVGAPRSVRSISFGSSRYIDGP